MNETWRKRLFEVEQRLASLNQDKTVAKDLCMSVMGRVGTAFYLFLDEILTDEQRHLMDQLEQRFLEGEPLAYLTGVAHFYGLSLQVDRRVLIPRPETEELVEWILTDHPESQLEVADIGTGSGNIALALKKNRPQWSVTASDFSPGALTVAKHNATKLGLSVNWLQGDLLQPHIVRQNHYHILVANLPYVAFDDEVQLNVAQYEPALALYANQKGLALYRILFTELTKVLVPGGQLYIEFGAAQAHDLIALAKELLPLVKWVLRTDVFGRDRMLRLTVAS